MDYVELSVQRKTGTYSSTNKSDVCLLRSFIISSTVVTASFNSHTKKQLSLMCTAFPHAVWGWWAVVTPCWAKPRCADFLWRRNTFTWMWVIIYPSPTRIASNTFWGIKKLQGVAVSDAASFRCRWVCKPPAFIRIYVKFSAFGTFSPIY